MDTFLAQLQNEVNQSDAFQEIKSQYDIANQQRQSIASSGAFASVATAIPQIPKAYSAVTTLFRSARVPYQIKSSVNKMVNTGLAKEDLGDAGERIMTLVKDVRASPELRQAFQNYAIASSKKIEGAMGNFNLEYNNITGKTVEFQNPNEINLAVKLDKAISRYNDFLSKARGKEGAELEIESDKFVGRLENMVKARINTVQKGTDVAEDIATEGTSTSTFENLANNVRGLGQGIGRALGEGFQEVAGRVGARATEFGRAVQDYASDLYDNIRGYGAVGDDVNLAEINNIFSDTDLSDFMLSRNPTRDIIQMNDLGEESELLDNELEPEEAVRTITAQTTAPNSNQTIGLRTEDEINRNQSSVTEPEPIDISSGQPQQAITQTTSVEATRISPQTGEALEPQLTSSNIAPSTTEVAEQISSTTGEALSQTAQTTASTIAENITSQIAETAVKSTSELVSDAVASASGFFGGVGDIISTLTSPVGFLVGIGGAVYSAYMALEPPINAPPPQVQTGVTFDPIKSELPASSIHF